MSAEQDTKVSTTPSSEKTDDVTTSGDVATTTDAPAEVTDTTEETAASDTPTEKTNTTEEKTTSTEQPPTGSPNPEQGQEQEQKQQSQPQETKTQEEQEAPKLNPEEETSKLEEKAFRFLAKQTHPVVIPSFATWFDISTIHEIEKRSLPDFFDDSSRYKSPKSYKDARDFIVNTYRLSPYEYLTVTAVRRNLAMDVASIVKIHSFLEKWGLINYQIDPRSKPFLIGPSFTGHFQIILDTPQGLKPLLPQKVVNKSSSISSPPSTTVHKEHEFDKMDIDTDDTATTTNNNTNDSTINQDTNKKQQLTSDLTQPSSQTSTTTETIKQKPLPFPVNLSLRKNFYDSVDDFNALQSQSKLSRQIQRTYICHTCGNDTMQVRYHNLRLKDANICARCFQEAHFGGNFQASDFIRLENNTDSNNNNNNSNSNSRHWSDQELLLLLEGLEMYEDQWDKIVEHVGGRKTLEDVVVKFLSLPIEDRYINDILKSEAGSKGLTKKPVSQIEAVDMAIRSLVSGQHKEVLDKSIPESSRRIADEYVRETQGIAQELVKLTLDKLEAKYEKLSKLEEALQRERTKYVQETEKLLSDRILLSKQIGELNTELAKMNISKKLVLFSDQVNSDIKLVDSETEKEEQTVAEGLKKVEIELEAISEKQPQAYKPWAL